MVSLTAVVFQAVCDVLTVDREDYDSRESEVTCASSTGDHAECDTRGSEAKCGEKNRGKILIQEKLTPFGHYISL